MTPKNKGQIDKKWLIIVVIAVIAAGSGVASWLGLFSDICGPSVQDQRITIFHQEVTFRLQEIREFLYQDQMTNRDLYNATQRIEAHGVGLSAEFKDTELRTLLFEFEQASPAKNQAHLQNIRSLFEELARLGPPAPFVDSDLPNPQKVQSARIKFEQIEREWQSLKP
jgi:hypothetical protein